jgi:hypothetical protein
MRVGVDKRAHPARSGIVSGGYLLAGAVGIVLGVGLGRAFVYPTPEPPTAMHKRSAAFMGAGEAAGAEISKMRRATFFIDNCSTPIVTPPSARKARLSSAGRLRVLPTTTIAGA